MPLFNKVIQGLKITFVVVVVFTATGMSIARLMMPLLNKYTDDVERWVSEATGQPVDIGAIDGRWHGITPELVLKDVRIFDKSGKKELMHTSSARVGVNLIDSIRNKTISVAGFTVTGIRLDFVRRSDGSFSLRNINLKSGKKDVKGSQEFINWLLSQPQLGLEDSEVFWHDELGISSDLNFRITNLYLHNDGMRHQLNGSLKLPASLGNEFHFSVDVTGDVLEPEKWAGEFYVDGNEVRLVEWMDEKTRRELAVRGGKVDFNFWGKWRASELQELEGRMSGAGLTLQADKESASLTADFTVGRFFWRRINNGWKFEADQLVMRRNGDTSPQSQVLVQLSDYKSTVPRIDISANHLRLQDINALALSAVGLSPEFREYLAGLSPRGDVNTLQISYQEKQKSLKDIILRASVKGLGVDPWKNVPGLSGVNGTLRHEGDHGALELDINQQQASIFFKQLFRESWPLNMVTGTVNWQHMGDAWRIDASELIVNNADINLQGRMRMDIFDDERAPFLDVVAGFHDGNGERVYPYLPASLLSQASLNWLDRAIVSGRAVSGGVIFRGAVDDFPFDNGKGKFEVRFNVENTLLEYADGWPAIDQIEAEVVFHGRSLDINAFAGKIFNADIVRAHVAIADLEAEESVLTVDGRVLGSVEDGLDYLRKSPLKSKFQNYLSKVKASGRSQLDLNMVIPLSDRKNTVRGSYELIDDTLTIGVIPAVSGINGKLLITEDTVTAENIRGKFLQEDIRIDVATRGEAQKGAAPGTTLSISSHLNTANLNKQIKSDWLHRIKGETDWRATLQFPDGWGGGKGQARLFIESSLNGMEVDLPHPLGKTREQTIPIDIVTELSGKDAHEVAVIYGDRLTFMLGLQQSEEKFLLQRAGVHIGNQGARLPEPGTVMLTGDLSGIVVSDWAEVLSGFAGKENQLKDKKLVIDADHIHIEREDDRKEAEASDSMNPTLIPSMKISSKRVTYGKAEIGTLKTEVVSIPTGVLAQDIELKSPEMTVTGQGAWVNEKQGPVSKFQLKLAHDDFGHMLKNLDYVSGVEGGSTQMELSAAWAGSPVDVSLEKLNGSLSMHIGKGRFTDLDPGVGRVFGLFSLQAIPRRLTLDFSDLFGKGFSYDQIDGTFTLEAGNAYTNNLIMDGPSAKIVASGRIGLDAEDYDQLVTVTPRLSGSVAVAGAVAGGPLGAVAALLVERLFKKQIRKATRYQYTVTGSWTDPVITKVVEREATEKPDE